MDSHIRVLIVDAATGFYRVERFTIGNFFGPVDLGLHLSSNHNSLNIGAGLLAGSIFPGSNRLFFSGFSPCWGGFYLSSMGGAALVFDNLGINMVSIIGRAPASSILHLNRVHGEEVQVELSPVNCNQVWNSGKGGIYSLMDKALERYGGRYENDPRILAVGPAALSTDFGAIASAPIRKGDITPVDTWAGRGGLGTKLLQQHNIASVIYGGTYIDEDFRDRNVADQWFVDKYQKKMAAQDLDSTTKYRYDERFNTGGTFGVNYATLKGHMLSFNYRSIYMDESERLDIHEKFIVNHYLKQFNEETIEKKQQKNCGEPCVAVCKKMHGEFKKDYEPYQTMGPLAGIFDQRAAEKLTHNADMYGFDAISAGGVVSWLMECVHEGYITPEEAGASERPVFTHENFSVVEDSMHNAEVGVQILDAIIDKKGIIDLSEGARKFARRLSRERGEKIINAFPYNAFARKGWMVPNQYWTPGTLSPMAIMGKYYMYYGKDFLPPRELGRKDAERFRQELILDNTGFCRFHRGWAEEMAPEIIESLYGLKERFLKTIASTATRINSRNSSVFWEPERNADIVYHFLKRKADVENVRDGELDRWIKDFEIDRKEASLNFWYEMHKGITESLKEF